MRRLSLGKAKLACQAAFTVLCVLYMCRWLWANWGTALSAWTGMDWPRLLQAAGLLAVSFLLLPSGVAIFLRSQVSGIGYCGSAVSYYGSQPAKYLPGSLWVYPSRLALLTQMGVSPTTSLAAVVFETVSLLASSALVGLLGLRSSLISQWRIPVLVCAGLVCVAVGWLVLPEALRLLPVRRLRASTILQRLSGVPLSTRTASLLSSVLLYSAMWSVAGLSFHSMIGALSSATDRVPAPFAVGTFALAWLLGFVSIVSPGGIGVRETVIASTLGTALPPSQAALAALLSRVLWTTLELVFFAVSLLIKRHVWRAPREAAPISSKNG